MVRALAGGVRFRLGAEGRTNDRRRALGSRPSHAPARRHLRLHRLPPSGRRSARRRHGRRKFVPKAYPLLTSLLDGIVGRIVPPFVLSKLEGDAAFAFATEGELGVRGQSVADCLTTCYDAYPARLDEARGVMTCTCDAYGSIGGLELKFVLHHGDYIVQSIAGHRELLGPEVTISHLLLKNHVADLVGRSAYALVTEPAVAHLGLPLERAVSITEQCEHYAPVQARVLTLR
jgi:Protein of unknown function (DUF2652)